MKKILPFIFIATFCIGLAGCDKKAAELKTVAGKTVRTDVIGAINGNTADSVVLKMTPRHLTATSLKKKATLTMLNKSSQPITTGERYNIDYWQHGKWITLDAFKGIAFDDIGYLLYPGKSRDFDILFFEGQGEYREGRYCVVKYFTIEGEKAPKPIHSCSVTFTVANH